MSTFPRQWPVRRTGIQRRTQQGFSMIEVLIALVVLAVGLLGLALLQTVNLRYTKSAEQRTHAVNLAGELLDTIRANSSEVAAYQMAPADFASVSVPLVGCAPNTNRTSAANIASWQCEVKEALGPDATANVDVAGAPDVVVTVTWDENSFSAITGQATVELETQL